MKFVKQFIDAVLFGNIYIALACICLIQSSVVQLQLPDSLIAYSVLTFFATLFIYNIQRVFYKHPLAVNTHSVRRVWVANNLMFVKTLAVIGFVGVLVVMIMMRNYNLILYLSPLLILSLMYFLPFAALRKNSLIKLIVLALVWTFVTAVLPLLLCNIAITFLQLVHICARFCFMVAICIPFDLRDIEIDRSDGISTLPILIGEYKAKIFALFFVLIYLILILIEYKFDMIRMPVLIALLLLVIITTFTVLVSDKKKSEYFYCALVDGTMILQGILVVAANAL